MYIYFTTSGSTSAGGNAFVGTLNDYRPIQTVMAPGYWSNMIYVIWITAAGAINVRTNTSVTTGASSAYVGFSYLLAD